jgi:hypothetical protein
MVGDGPSECLGSPPKSDPVPENVATKFSGAPSVSGTEFRPRRDENLRPRARRDRKFPICDHPMKPPTILEGKPRKQLEIRLLFCEALPGLEAVMSYWLQTGVKSNNL